MKKYFHKFTTFVLILSILGGIFLPYIQIAAQEGAASRQSNTSAAIGVQAAGGDQAKVQQIADQNNNPPPPEGWWDTIKCIASPFDCALRNMIAGLAGMALSLAGLLTGLSAVILNSVIYYTIVSVKDNYDQISGINSAWKVVRDVSNMVFIFILLYAAIKTIVGAGSDSQKLVVKVVVVAILINFSMFATMLVIDASNLLALTFYEAIAPGALKAGAFSAQQAGLADAFTQHMSLSSLYNAAGTISFKNIITIGVMGSTILLIAAFSFFAVAIMLLVRYVLLIMVIILSPIAFLAYAFPEVKGHADRWRKTLFGQAFFAPIYFMLTWVALEVLDGIMKSSVFGTKGRLAAITNLDGSTTGWAAEQLTDLTTTLVNFGIVIIFLLTSLIVAKQWANKAEGAGAITGWATKLAGGATLGTAGWVGKNTIGAGASRLAQSERFQNLAGRSWAGQKLYQGTQKAASSTFDARNTRVASKVGGMAGVDLGTTKKTGGFDAQMKEKMDKKQKFAQTLRNDDAKRAYANRITRNTPLNFTTFGGTRNSARTLFGTMGRHNRVAASKIINDQRGPLKTQQESLQSREAQLQDQFAKMGNELATLHALGASRNAQQDTRFALLNGLVTERGSLAYVDKQLQDTQAQLTNVTKEVDDIDKIISDNQLDNDKNQITNRVTGKSRNARADEQQY